MANLSDKRIWLILVERHLRMARHLARATLYDGAVFHTYHAFECFISAGISSSGLSPKHPGQKYMRSGVHVAKMSCFRDIYKGQAMATEADALLIHLCGLTGKAGQAINELRNCLLYHDAGSIRSWLLFKKPVFEDTYKRVRSFVYQFQPLL